MVLYKNKLYEISDNDIKRFNLKYEINNETGCWNWIASLMRGYARFRFFEIGIGHTGHVFSYLLHKGNLKNGLYVCHKCDNRKCVNPDHLFLGTQKDNVQDCKNKGRLNRASGEAHSQSKLTDEIVLKIRREYKTGIFTQKDLSEHYSIYISHMRKILNREIWRNI